MYLKNNEFTIVFPVQRSMFLLNLHNFIQLMDYYLFFTVIVKLKCETHSKILQVMNQKAIVYHGNLVRKWQSCHR